MDDVDEPTLDVVRQVLVEPDPTKREIAVHNLGVAQKSRDSDDLHMYLRVDLGIGTRAKGIKKSRIDYLGGRFNGDLVEVDTSSRRILLQAGDENVSYEDPRAQSVEGTGYLTYTKFNRKYKTVDIELAASDDFEEFYRIGTISPRLSIPEALRRIGSKKKYAAFHRAIFETWRAKDFWAHASLDFKDMALFSEKIDNQFALVFRVLPHMFVLKVDNLEYLKDHDFWMDEVFTNLQGYLLMKTMGGCEGWQGNRIGISPPPIKLPEELGEYGKWLLIYHGARLSPKQYCIGAAVLDENLKVTRRTQKPLIAPDQGWQRNGVVNNVVYITGAAFNQGLHLFGGGADKVCFQTGPFQLEDIIKKCERV